MALLARLASIRCSSSGRPDTSTGSSGTTRSPRLRLRDRRVLALLDHVEEGLPEVDLLGDELVQRVGHLGDVEEVLDDGLHPGGAGLAAATECWSSSARLSTSSISRLAVIENSGVRSSWPRVLTSSSR